MEWQPIETAPKDGTPILVYANIVSLVEWLEDTGGRWAWCEPSSWQDEQGGYTTVNFPTHWMPLPNPPTDATTKHLKCNECGAPVTSPVPQSTITTAYMLCADCLESVPDDIACVFLEHAAKRAKALKEEATP